MALPKTNDVKPLFLVVTMIIALILSLYFIQGQGLYGTLANNSISIVILHAST